MIGRAKIAKKRILEISVYAGNAKQTHNKPIQSDQRRQCWLLEQFSDCPADTIVEYIISLIIPILSASLFVYLAYFSAPKYKKYVASGAFGFGAIIAIIFGYLVNRIDVAILAISAGGLTLKLIYLATKEKG